MYFLFFHKTLLYFVLRIDLAAKMCYNSMVEETRDEESFVGNNYLTKINEGRYYVTISINFNR